MKHNTSLGTLFALMSAFMYALQAAVVKLIGLHVPMPMLVFMQSLIGLLFILPVVLYKGKSRGKKIISTQHLRTHIIRACASIGISFFFFYAIRYIPMVDAVLLVNTAPLLVPIIALIIFHQKINHKLWLPLSVGFIGIMTILRPDANLFNPATLIGLAAGACMATSMLLVRKTSKDDGPMTILFYFFLLSTLITGVIAAFSWQAIAASTFGLLILVGLLYFFVQIGIATALTYTTANIASTVYYSNIIFSAGLATLIWHNAFTWPITVGIILTIGGGIACIQIQHRQQQEAARG